MADLEIRLGLDPQDRAADAVNQKFEVPFLQEIAGAKSKELRVRHGDARVLRRFPGKQLTETYLESAYFIEGVATALEPLLQAEPEFRIYVFA